MTALAKQAGTCKWEKLRRVRYGDVLKLIRHRYGANGVPNDDAGRPDLMELLYLTSATPAGAEKKVRNCIEIFAPWMQGEEVEGLVQHLTLTPDYQKARTSEELGKVLHVTNAERERLRLWSIRPCDLTTEEFAEQSKARSQKRCEAKRRAQGMRSREEYLAELKARPKPWIAEGISRRTWERRLSRQQAATEESCRMVLTDMSQGLVETIVSKDRTHLATRSKGWTREKGLQGSVATGSPVATGSQNKGRVGNKEARVLSDHTMRHRRMIPG
jgi:hypothetical protein